MNDATEAVTRLRTVASQVRGLIVRLNTQSSTCRECSLKHFEDFNEAKMAQDLARISDQLMKRADVINRWSREAAEGGKHGDEHDRAVREGA